MTEQPKMLTKEKSNRRQFIRIGTGVTGLFAFSGGMLKSFAQSCGLTAPQTSGPFYPGASEFGENTDLTLNPVNGAQAKGQVVYLKGRVVDQNCNPIQNANVEIWQACASGKYNSRKDPNPAPLDPNFKYWAETFTDTKGEYKFKTIIPGAYPADNSWTRPPHIHFKISCLGYRELITQMYFKGNELNDRDLILQDLTVAERENVIVHFRTGEPEYPPGSLVGNFEITLRSVRTQ